MPKVPTYDSFQATPNTLPQSFAKAPDVLVDPGQSSKEMGAMLTHAGDAFGKIVQDMHATANQLRLDDATNQLREGARKLQFDKDVGYTNLKGKAALDRPGGLSLSDEYGGKLQEHVDQIAATLGNDQQREAFAHFSGGFVQGFKSNISAHEVKEFTDYGLSVSDGIQKGAIDDIGLNWNNPAAVNDAVSRIQAETYRQAHLLGKSAEWQDAQSKTLTSLAHKTALMTALDNNNPAYADDYLKRYASQMHADDILTVKGQITKEMDNHIGMSASADVIQKIQPQIQIGDAERAFNILIGTESGGKQFAANGQPLTSPKGAVGVAQVMPSTGPEAAALAGLPYDETKYKNDASYNKALGLAYFQKQLQDNGGELSKAYAAYNAGPEALKQAVDEADKEGGDWLTYLPKETQKYVTGNMKAYASGEGKPPRATFEEIDAQLRSDPRIAGNPDRYKIARGDAKQRFEEQTQAIKQRDEDALANALKGVEQNGGRFSDLPPSVRAAVPVDKRDTVINYAQKVAKGDDTTSPWLYSKFSDDPSKDPHTGEPMSDSAFYRYRPELSDADFRKFTDERNKRAGKTAGNGGPGDLNSAAIKQNLDTNLWNLGIKPNPKSDSENERVGAIRKFVDDYFVAAQREAGKKFTDAEVSTHLNNLFAKNETFKRFWSSDTKGPLLSMEIGDIPSGDKTAIKESFKKQGVSDPTDAQVLNAFFMSKVTK